jgi:hypothetical protein
MPADSRQRPGAAARPAGESFPPARQSARIAAIVRRGARDPRIAGRSLPQFRHRGVDK